ncbi:hypothetical protein BEN48_10880 [Hymenobacter glacialis]|uniref:Uncharacterized protein n=1 Tax=Hymenobacter glacialis TaxID=1908236 RepID=A0A1G1TAC1_9BACT|nr:hypothetical protein BEN48_10880 [Hymenobacter glacialis]
MGPRIFMQLSAASCQDWAAAVAAKQGFVLQWLRSVKHLPPYSSTTARATLLERCEWDRSVRKAPAL